jgi:hypothetical protein
MHRLTDLMAMSRKEQLEDFLNTYVSLADVAIDKGVFIIALRKEDISLRWKLQNCFQRYINPIGLNKVFVYAPTTDLTDQEINFLIEKLKQEFL